MKVTKADIVTSAVRPEHYPKTDIPEVALAGRSNVGKSSFINKMINRKSLARTSQKPGKTQLLNFYSINDVLHFVDVPGYGFAKVSKKEQEAWGTMVETYIQERRQLKAIIQIIDVRHDPTKDDQLMYDWLKYHEVPVILIATKADKIPKGKWAKHIKRIRDVLGVDKEDSVVLFSSETAEGKEKAWSQILHHIK